MIFNKDPRAARISNDDEKVANILKKIKDDKEGKSPKTKAITKLKWSQAAQKIKDRLAARRD